MSALNLNDLHEDVWTVILQFVSLDDLLVKEKLFGTSSRIFTTLIGCDINEWNVSSSDPHHHNEHDYGSLFYRMLNEKLIIQQLENCMNRINSRKFFLHEKDDYIEETNSHTIAFQERVLAEKREMGLRGRIRRQFFSRSRLNAQSSGNSMCKLRSELKKLIETCHAQFPHIYLEKKLQIENSLRRSIKVCTPVNQAEDTEISYHDNSQFRPNKLLIWN